ncbi:MAG: archaellin/type IV pilin N-terminal domain-containing protein [Candidatus Baldrarchaeia archaeon]
MKSRKGISPVIATIIIVAVAIAIAIAVAYWVVGIAGIFTRFEKLEISAAWVTASGSNNVIHLKFNNTGSAPATITDVFINGVPYNQFSGGSVTLGGDLANLPLTLDPGEGGTGTLTASNTVFKSGVTYEITLHTASGKDYPKAVAVP